MTKDLTKGSPMRLILGFTLSSRCTRWWTP